jgi:hypothetical protein
LRVSNGVGQSYSPNGHPTLYELYSSNPQPQAGNVDGMEYAKLETAALAHVDDSYYYGAYCRKCKHSGRLSLVKLRAIASTSAMVSR